MRRRRLALCSDKITTQRCGRLVIHNSMLLPAARRALCGFSKYSIYLAVVWSGDPTASIVQCLGLVLGFLGDRDSSARPLNDSADKHGP